MAALGGQHAIEGFRLEPLKEIADERGAVLHMMRADSPMFSRFGEVYFSEVRPGVVKAWKRHREMTQNLAVPAGRIRIVLYDDRDGSPSRGELVQAELGRPDAYHLAQIPPRVWYGFQALGERNALVANCADLAHDPGESESVAPDAGFIPFDWTRPTDEAQGA